MLCETRCFYSGYKTWLLCLYRIACRCLTRANNTKWYQTGTIHSQTIRCEVVLFQGSKQKGISHAGNWTRTSWVKARYPSHWTTRDSCILCFKDKVIEIYIEVCLIPTGLRAYMDKSRGRSKPWVSYLVCMQIKHFQPSNTNLTYKTLFKLQRVEGLYPEQNKGQTS